MDQGALRKQIIHVNDSLIPIRQAAQEDFDLLAEWETEHHGKDNLETGELVLDKEFSLAQQMDMYRIMIAGYAAQVGGYGRIVEDMIQARQILEEQRLFGRLFFSAWYLAESHNYPAVKQYIEMVDYLRLLILQYLHIYHP